MRLYNVREESFATGHFTKNFLSMLLILAALGITGISCSESLPPYRSPEDIFEGKIWGKYVLTQNENCIKVYAAVRNLYDETVQSTAVLQGRIEIIWSKDMNIRKTVIINASNLVYARNYNRTTGVLTLDPGDSLCLEYSWDLVADNGVNLISSSSEFFIYLPDTTCKSGRMIAREQTFMLRGELTVFSQVASVWFGLTTFTFCRVDRWVPVTGCPWINPDYSCIYPQPHP